MNSATIARTAQVQTPQGWMQTSLSKLQSGQQFRVIKPDGSVVCGSTGATVFQASGPIVTQPITEALRARVLARFAGCTAATAALA